MDHEHSQQNTCQYCAPKPNEPIISPNAKTKIMSFLGVCGSISCYVAMFPAILLGVIGILGLSQPRAASALNAYMGSALFQPILVVSILLLAAGIFRYGKLPMWFSILGGIGIFMSMNFYMREWLFTFSFALIALAYYLALRQTKSPQLKFAFVLLLAVVLFGVVDIGRALIVKNSAPSQILHQPANNMNKMNQR